MKQFLGKICLAAFLLTAAQGFSQELALSTEDLRIDVDTMPGYHLKIRKKPGVASVLLVESTESSTRRPATYAYKTSAYNAINGGEKRLLDGELLPQEDGYFLIDSTPEPDAQFGEAFHIFIPYVLQYGYPWSRQGEVQALDGAYFNIRSFSKPYADYSGGYRDNPYTLRIVQRPLPGPPEDNFMPAAVDAFTKLADEGEAIKSPGKEAMIDDIERAIAKQKGRTIDFVLALDTTQSMHDDIPYLRSLLVPMIRKHLDGFDSFRVGLVLYRDYYEEYLTKVFPFTTDLDSVQKLINAVRVVGGRDIPEAVHETLDAAIHGYDWQAENRLIVLVGDAPPHPKPRGKITEESVKRAAKEKNIALYTIILPQ